MPNQRWTCALIIFMAVFCRLRVSSQVRQSAHLKKRGSGIRCVVAHEHDDIGDPFMTKRIDRAIIETRGIQREVASAVAIS
jgi:hypothetical protein